MRDPGKKLSKNFAMVGISTLTMMATISLVFHARQVPFGGKTIHGNDVQYRNQDQHHHHLLHHNPHCHNPNMQQLSAKNVLATADSDDGDDVEYEATFPPHHDDGNDGPDDNKDVKQFSYVCLEINQDRCLGISPGNKEPTYNPPDEVYEMQIKPRVNNENSGEDYKKTRWDVNFDNKTISLSRFSDLCVARHPDTRINRVYLLPCSESGTRKLFDMEFNKNIDQRSVVQSQDQDRPFCLTVMHCNSPSEDQGWCDSESNDIMASSNKNDYIPGSYVKLRPCYWTEQGNPDWEPAQVWRQRLDCAVGCPPFLQENGQCDEACDNRECDWDNGSCATPSPTPPTPAPTKNPTVSPTFSPTLSPTTSSPTTSPTVAPTRSPSVSPTPNPTRSPTVYPTSSPSLAPTPVQPTTATPTTDTPTSSPTEAPTSSPTPKPTDANFFQEDRESSSEFSFDLLLAIIVPLVVLIIGCCVFCLFGARRNKDKELKDPENWKSPVPANKDVFQRFREAREARSKGCWASLCCCVGNCKKQDQNQSGEPDAEAGRMEGFATNVDADFS